jgi:hypothetical protein
MNHGARHTPAVQPCSSQQPHCATSHCPLSLQGAASEEVRLVLPLGPRCRGWRKGTTPRPPGAKHVELRCALSASTTQPSAARFRQQLLHGAMKQGSPHPSPDSPVRSAGRPQTACPRALSALPTPPQALPSGTAPCHSTPRPWPSATTSPKPARV